MCRPAGSLADPAPEHRTFALDQLRPFPPLLACAGLRTALSAFELGSSAMSILSKESNLAPFVVALVIDAVALAILITLMPLKI